MSEKLRIIEGRKHIIKSCRPTKFGPGELYTLGINGPIGDREFMVVDEESHSFRTQRNRHPGYRRLALVQPSIHDEQLVLETKRFPQTAFPLDPAGRETILAEIWDDQVESLIYKEGSEWFSDFLKQRCLLVRKNARRLINRQYVSHSSNCR